MDKPYVVLLEPLPGGPFFLEAPRIMISVQDERKGLVRSDKGAEALSACARSTRQFFSGPIHHNDLIIYEGSGASGSRFVFVDGTYPEIIIKAWSRLDRH